MISHRSMTTFDLATRLANPRYPRSAHYDPTWAVGTRMGPNVLWLTEWLSEAARWSRGDRVLDLGCGMAASSIFLAREFDVVVWAADLWIDPSDNWQRIQHENLEDRVFPVRVEAHQLPFADEYFDAIVSVDAYHYFGTETDYLSYIRQFLRPGGALSIVVPSVRHELDGRPPDGLAPYWHDDMFTFHTPAWWVDHLGAEMTVRTADWLQDGWKEWLVWCEVCGDHLRPKGLSQGDDECAEMLRVDAGRTLGVTRIVAGR
jgi:cyclopropane fatty-acyl-phospholipid synthase-like methyltransferase